MEAYELSRGGDGRDVLLVRRHRQHREAAQLVDATEGKVGEKAEPIEDAPPETLLDGQEGAVLGTGCGSRRRRSSSEIEGRKEAAARSRESHGVHSRPR